MQIRAVFLALVLAMPVCTEDAGGLFVAVGCGGRPMSSRVGRTWKNEPHWSEVAPDDDNVLFNVTFGLGRFIAVK